MFAPFRLDAATRELRKHEERIALPPRVFACLLYLIERHERAVGRDELIEALWDGPLRLDVQLAQLILQCRRAVDDDGQGQRAIRTVTGFGYRLGASLAGRRRMPLSIASVVARRSRRVPRLARLPRLSRSRRLPGA